MKRLFLLTTLLFSSLYGINQFDHFDELIQAINDNDMATVQELLALDPQLVNCSSPDGITPLMLAVYDNNIELVQFLVERGANLNAALTKNGQILRAIDLALAMYQHGVTDDLVYNYLATR